MLIKAKSIKPVQVKAGSNKGKTIGFIAELESFEDKMAVLRGSKKLLENEQMKNLFLKPNQTAEERKRENN